VKEPYDWNGRRRGAFGRRRDRMKNSMIHKAILALVVGSIVLGTAACNMVHGAGRDLESASDAVKRATH
jgi:predicted small secreted protein